MKRTAIAKGPGGETLGTRSEKVQHSGKLYSHAIAQRINGGKHKILSWHTTEQTAGAALKIWGRLDPNVFMVPVIVVRTNEV